MGSGRNRAWATVTSPLGSTWIQRGCLRPVANALTLSPGAATGVCPGAQPLAVGILSVGMLPCGLAAGIAGVLPTAASSAPLCSRRHRIAAAPISATSFAKMLDTLMTFLPLMARMLSRIHLKEPPRVCHPRDGAKRCTILRTDARHLETVPSPLVGEGQGEGAGAGRRR